MWCSHFLFKQHEGYSLEEPPIISYFLGTKDTKEIIEWSMVAEAAWPVLFVKNFKLRDLSFFNWGTTLCNYILRLRVYFSFDTSFQFENKFKLNMFIGV